MGPFLALQITYQYIEVGIFDGQKLLGFTQKDKGSASTHLTYYLDDLLKRTDLVIRNISFIAACQGPAPFTSLRVLLSLLNGISFATNIPLVGVDGLTHFLLEHRAQKKIYTIALFNAFAHDAYFGILSPQGTIEVGYENIYDLVSRIQSLTTSHTIKWIGDGIVYFFDLLEQHGFKPDTKDLPSYLSLQSLGMEGYRSYIAGNKTWQLTPLYGKHITYHSSIT